MRLFRRIFYLSFLLLSCQGSEIANAGLRFGLGPEITFFSINGTDNATQANAVLSTRRLFALNAQLSLPIGGIGEGFLRFRARSFEMGVPDGTPVEGVGQVQTMLMLGLMRPMGKKLVLHLFADYNEYLLMRAASTQVIRLVDVRWPGGGMLLEYFLFQIGKVFRVNAVIGGGVAIPIDNYGYGVKMRGMSYLKAGFYAKKWNLVFSPIFNFETVSAPEITQYYAEAGGQVFFTWNFGKGSGRYEFLFSPRK